MTWSIEAIDWDKTLTAAVGVAAVVQAFVGVVMMRGLKHSEHSANTAERARKDALVTSKRQLRPYVLVEKVEFFPPTAENEHYGYVKTHLRNTGQTPAIQLQGTGEWMSFASEELINGHLSIPTTRIGASTYLGPGMTVTFHIPMDAAQFEVVKAGVQRGYVLGMVGQFSYRDIFDRSWEYNYRRRLTPQLNDLEMHPTVGCPDTERQTVGPEDNA